MKNKLLYLLTLSVVISCSTKKENNSYLLIGKVDKPINDTILLINESDEIFPIEVTNGKFRFSGITQHPECIMLTWKNDYKKSSFYAFKFFVEPNSTNDLILNKDSIDFSSANGSVSQEKYNALKKEIGEIKAIWLKEYTKNPSNDSLIKKMGQYYSEKISHVETSFIKNNPSSYVSPYILSNKLESIISKEHMSLYNHLDTNLSNSKYYQVITNEIRSRKLAKVGAKMLNFKLKDTNNNPCDFYRLALNKTVLIDIWFSGCKPCRKANAELKKLYSEFKNENFEIISVSVDKNKDSWKNAIKSDGMDWINLIDNKMESDLLKYYPTESYPTTYFLNKEGIIQAINPSYETIRNYLLENK